MDVWGPPVTPLPPERPTPPRVNHLLHLALTLVTGGLWAFVWLLVIADNRAQRRALEIGYARDLNRYNRRAERYNQHVAGYVNVWRAPS